MKAVILDCPLIWAMAFLPPTVFGFLGSFSLGFLTVVGSVITLAFFDGGSLECR